VNGFEDIEQYQMREVPDEFSDCINGYCLKSNLPIYSMKKMVRIIEKRGVNYYDAIDIFNKTFIDSDLGENEPIFLQDLEN